MSSLAVKQQCRPAASEIPRPDYSLDAMPSLTTEPALFQSSAPRFPVAGQEHWMLFNGQLGFDKTRVEEEGCSPSHLNMEMLEKLRELPHWTIPSDKAARCRDWSHRWAVL